MVGSDAAALEDSSNLNRLLMTVETLPHHVLLFSSRLREGAVLLQPQGEEPHQPQEPAVCARRVRV